jgi:hypothetical protein
MPLYLWAGWFYPRAAGKTVGFTTGAKVKRAVLPQDWLLLPQG